MSGIVRVPRCTGWLREKVICRLSHIKKLSWRSFSNVRHKSLQERREQLYHLRNIACVEWGLFAVIQLLFSSKDSVITIALQLYLFHLCVLFSVWIWNRFCTIASMKLVVYSAAIIYLRIFLVICYIWIATRRDCSKDLAPLSN